MIDFFYGLSIWPAILLILALSLAIGLGSSFAVRRVFALHSTTEEAQTALSLMQVVAAYIGILIAFAGVQVWQDYADAENSVHREAATAAQLYRSLAAYGPETKDARQDLRAYVKSIVEDEWPLLAEGKASGPTEVALFNLFESMSEIRPQDSRDSTIYTEAFSNMDDLVALRRDRLIHSDAQMPMILWVVGLVGSVLIVAYTATFPPTRTNTAMIAGISLALGLVFLFIMIVDRPFMGRFSVSNSELAGLTQKFDLLDRMSAAESRASRASAIVSGPPAQTP